MSTTDDTFKEARYLTIYYEAVTPEEDDALYDAIVDSAADILATTTYGEEAFGFAQGGPAEFQNRA